MEPFMVIAMIVSGLMRNGPSIAVYVVGIVLAVRCRRHNPKVFTLAGAGFAGLLASVVVNSLLGLRFLASMNHPESLMRNATLSGVFNFGTDLLHAGSLALVLVALFGPVVSPARFRQPDAQNTSPPPIPR